MLMIVNSTTTITTSSTYHQFITPSEANVDADTEEDVQARALYLLRTTTPITT